MKDNDIVRGIRENSEAAWRALYAATHDKFARMVSRSLGKESVTTFDDVYEQACLDLMENVKAGKLQEGDAVNLSGYLYTICMRKAIRANESRTREELRKQKYGKEKAAEDASDGNLPGEDPNPKSAQKEDEDAWEQALALLDEALSRIPERCRAILRRFYWDKMSMKDIAAAMGLKNDDVAKATKNKCMNKFKSVAREMLADDEALDAAVRRAVERDALRDLLEECRKASSGEWDIAALKGEDDADQ